MRDVANLLREAADSPRSVPSTFIAYDDQRRTAVLLSNFRSGSHFLKLTLDRLGVVRAGRELLTVAGEDQSGHGYTLGEHCAALGHPMDLLSDANGCVRQFLADFYRHSPKVRTLLLDVKYPHAYAFGVDTSMDAPIAVPIFIKEAVSMGFPFLHLVRRDMTAQAISAIVAERSSRYLVMRRSASDIAAGVTSQVDGQLSRIDPREVLERAVRLKNARAVIEASLAASGANVLTLTYEDISGNNWREPLRAVMRHLDRFADIPKDFVFPTMRQESQKSVSNLPEIRAYISERDTALNG